MASSTATPAASEGASPPRTTAAAAPISRGRRITVWILVLVASLLAVVAILTTWVKRQMLDNTAWNKATAQIIQDPKVQSAIATYAVNQVYENVNVAQALQERLPKNLAPLAAPVAGALQAPATQGVKLLLQRPRVQQLFINASTIAHEKLVNVLENKTGHGISTGNGEVTLNLHEFIVSVGGQLGLPADALARLPSNTGTVTLMKSDQLSTAQTGVRAIRVLSAWLLVAVFALYGLAIYLARGSRRATLRNSGLALVVVGLIVLVVRRLLGNYIIDALASPGYQPATHRMWLIGTAILGQIGAAAILYGAVAALAAVFAGPTSPAVWLRQRLAPYLNEQQGIVWAVVGFVYLLLVLWGGTHALRTWWGILLLGGLIAAGVFALRRETLQEFPSAAPAGHPAQPPDEAPTQPTAPQGSPAEEIARLQELHKSGAITDDEFERAKNALA